MVARFTLNVIPAMALLARGQAGKKRFRKILTHLGKPLEPPPVSPARGPPTNIWLWRLERILNQPGKREVGEHRVQHDAEQHHTPPQRIEIAPAVNGFSSGRRAGSRSRRCRHAVHPIVATTSRRYRSRFAGRPPARTASST